MSNNITKTLSLSLLHLDRDGALFLSKLASDLHVHSIFRSGATLFVKVPSDKRVFGMAPQCIQDVVSTAIDMDCVYLVLEPEAPVLKGLKTYVNTHPSFIDTHQFTVKLNDMMDDTKPSKKATVTISTQGLTLDLEGVQTFTGDGVAQLEHYDGVLELLVWADEESEELTNRITLN